MTTFSQSLQIAMGDVFVLVGPGTQVAVGHGSARSRACSQLQWILKTRNFSS
jgi:hypothetical protein